MAAPAERRVRREDIDRYRRVLTELGGEASLEHLAQRTGESDLDYIAACLIVPEPTQANPSVMLPWAIPSAYATDAEGRRLWRTEVHWTADDLGEARRYLGLGQEGE